MRRPESLVRGAAALALAGLIIKISNLLVRIPLTRLLGSDGLGIYQMSLPAFFALYHIAAGGVPVAVQNLVAEYLARGRRRAAEQVLRMGLTYATLAGAGAACALLLGAAILARMMGEPRTYWALVAVAPAIPLFAIDSVYRNYLQGRKLMSPSAAASLLEQGTKVVATLVAPYLLVRHGTAEGAAGAALGITLGALVSVLYMGRVYRRIRMDDQPESGKAEPGARLVGRMVRLAWPVTLGSLSMPLLSLLDVGIIQRGFLAAGHGQAATAMYGAYSGIAVQVVWFPFVLTNALANALFPVLSEAAARGDRSLVRARVILGLRVTTLLCLPVAVAIAVLNRPIAALFGEPLAQVPLLYMGPVALLGPLAWLIAAQLQALGKTAPPMRNFALALLVKIGLDALLAPMPGVDIKGVAVASVAMFALACWLNVWALEGELDAGLPWSLILRGPLLASTAMGGALLGMGAAGWLPEPGWAALAVGAAVAPVLYLAILLMTRTLTVADMAAMAGPFGSRLERALQAVWPWG